jgi:hypothetical protein
MNLWVEIFEWPTRFLVEATEKDKALMEFFNDETAYPFLVDLEIPECPCYDFQQNILPERHLEHSRKNCKHLAAAISYRYLLGEKPKPLPPIIIQ